MLRPPPSNWSRSCFTDVAIGVVNKYFDHYFPQALATSAALAANKSTDAELVFTTHSWLVSLYLKRLAKTHVLDNTLNLLGADGASNRGGSLREGREALHELEELRRHVLAQVETEGRLHAPLDPRPAAFG